MDEDPRVVGIFLSRRNDLIEYAARYVGHGLAEDVVQDAFIRVARIRTEERRWAEGPRGEIRNLTSYIFAVVRNQALDRSRQLSIERRRHSMNDQLESIAHKDPSPEDLVLRREQQELLQDALASLPPRTRLAFEMHRIEKQPLREIAIVLGVPIARAGQLSNSAAVYLAKHLPDLD